MKPLPTITEWKALIARVAAGDLDAVAMMKTMARAAAGHSVEGADSMLDTLVQVLLTARKHLELAEELACELATECTDQFHVLQLANAWRRLGWDKEAAELVEIARDLPDVHHMPTPEVMALINAPPKIDD